MVEGGNKSPQQVGLPPTVKDGVVLEGSHVSEQPINEVRTRIAEKRAMLEDVFGTGGTEKILGAAQLALIVASKVASENGRLPTPESASNAIRFSRDAFAQFMEKAFRLTDPEVQGGIQNTAEIIQRLEENLQRMEDQNEQGDSV